MIKNDLDYRNDYSDIMVPWSLIIVQDAMIMPWSWHDRNANCYPAICRKQWHCPKSLLSAGEYVPPWPAKNSPLTYNSQIPLPICCFSQSYRCPPFYAAKLFMVGCRTIHRQVYSLKLLFRIMFDFFLALLVVKLKPLLYIVVHHY